MLSIANMRLRGQSRQIWIELFNCNLKQLLFAFRSYVRNLSKTENLLSCKKSPAADVNIAILLASSQCSVFYLRWFCLKSSSLSSMLNVKEYLWGKETQCPFRNMIKSYCNRSFTAVLRISKYFLTSLIVDLWRQSDLELWIRQWGNLKHVMLFDLTHD